jgi:hypothetical protein
VIAAEPGEIKPVVHLVFHFSRFVAVIVHEVPFQYTRVNRISPMAPSWILLIVSM